MSQSYNASYIIGFSQAFENNYSTEDANRPESALREASDLQRYYESLPSYLLDYSSSPLSPGFVPSTGYQSLILSIHHYSFLLSLLKPYLYVALSNPTSPTSFPLVERAIHSAKVLLYTFHKAHDLKFPLAKSRKTILAAFRSALCLSMYLVRDSSFPRVEAEELYEGHELKELVQSTADILR
jgi:hypothetical protein